MITRSSSGAPLAPANDASREHARQLIAHARSDNTIRAYEGSWRRFSTWMAARGAPPTAASVEDVACFLADRHRGAFPPGSEALAPVSLEREYNGVAFYLRAARPEAWPKRRPPAAIAELLAGAHRANGRPPDRKRPLLAKHFVQLASMGPDALGAGVVGVRNRALLLLGFAGAFRRTELVDLDRGDVALEAPPGGLRVTLRRSKGDQQARGFVKGILRAEEREVCPVRALAIWMHAAGITADGAAGPLFRRIDRTGRITGDRITDELVADTVKRACVLLGLPPERYAGHSLRSGFVTTTALQGATLDEIMCQTGHKSVEQVREYIRRENVFQANPTERLFTGTLFKRK